MTFSIEFVSSNEESDEEKKEDDGHTCCPGHWDAGSIKGQSHRVKRTILAQGIAFACANPLRL